MQGRMLCSIQDRVHAHLHDHAKSDEERQHSLHQLQRVVAVGRWEAEHPDLEDSAEARARWAAVSSDVLALLGDYNAQIRLAVPRKDVGTWPQPQLCQNQGRFAPFSLIPPPSPCEYVPESLAWSCWGAFDRESEWLGHGWFWRPPPLKTQSDPSTSSTSENGQPVKEKDEKDENDNDQVILTNMASNSSSDYDMLEDRFHRLKRASVLVADYALLRHDFPELLGHLDDPSIDAWLLRNVACLSEGAVRRISPSGDHHALLGVEAAGGLDALVEREPFRSGLRMRSGGRAASLFLEDGYSFDADGWMHAALMDVKGLGTHAQAAFSESPKNTGFLNLADCLRELAYQRLIQRLCVNAGVSRTCETVQFYGIIDTGLAYADGVRNPSTGFLGDRCVLALRQRQSRAFVAYQGYNFSGVLLMTGEDPPQRSVAQGGGRMLREVLMRQGVSAEFVPQAIWRTEQGEGGRVGILGSETAMQEALEDLSGVWNLQADAALSHFLDFSDYYALPGSPLPNFRMSDEAFRRACALERHSFQDELFRSPVLMQRVFGTADPDAAREARMKLLTELAEDEKILAGSNGTDVDPETGKAFIKNNPPRYCMCWFFELDDSEMSQWALANGYGQRGPILLETIESWLPPLETLSTSS